MVGLHIEQGLRLVNLLGVIVVDSVEPMYATEPVAIIYGLKPADSTGGIVGPYPVLRNGSAVRYDIQRELNACDRPRRDPEITHLNGMCRSVTIDRTGLAHRERATLDIYEIIGGGQVLRTQLPET